MFGIEELDGVFENEHIDNNLVTETIIKKINSVTPDKYTNLGTTNTFNLNIDSEEIHPNDDLAKLNLKTQETLTQK